MKKDIEKLIIKLHHLIAISELEKSKDAYMYSINELNLILEGHEEL